jgi:hypothetical protein
MSVTPTQSNEDSYNNELEFILDDGKDPDRILSEVMRIENEIEQLQDERAELLDTDFEAKLSIQDRISRLEAELRFLRTEAGEALNRQE